MKDLLTDELKIVKLERLVRAYEEDESYEFMSGINISTKSIISQSNEEQE
jgi:hypothetical protein